MLHSLGVIDFSGAPIVKWEDSDGFIEAGGDEFFTSWCEIDVKNSANMIFVNQFGLLRLPEVKSVALAIFVSHDEVHGFLRIPANGGGLVLQVDFVDRSLSANIIKAYASILCHTGKQIHLTGVELDLVNCIDAPLKALHG